MTTVRIERVPYGGWTNNLLLANGEIELVATLEVGPRVLRYAPRGGRNVLGEMPADLGGTGEAGWRMRGGHRLWVSPEDPARSYVPDNGPVGVETLGDRVRLTTPADPVFGLEKSLEIALAERGSEVTLTHRIRNVGEAKTELSVWALTVMAAGGEAIVPLPTRSRHPGEGASSPADFAPAQTMALWPYFSFADPRLSLGERYLRVRQDRTRGATKLGLAHRGRWAAYWNAGTLFAKRFSYVEAARYPDGGCNFECYTDTDILELESLGPLTELAPGAEVAHVETWTMDVDVPAPTDEESIGRSIAARLG